MKIKVTNAIKDGMHIAIIFSLDKNTKIKQGDKLDLSVVDFNGEIELKEMANSYRIIKEEVVNGKYKGDYVIFESENYASYVDYPGLKRIMRVLSNIANYEYELGDFDIYLYNDDYPVIFIENMDWSHRDYADVYGFVIAPLRRGDEDEGEGH